MEAQEFPPVLDDRIKVLDKARLGSDEYLGLPGLKSGEIASVRELGTLGKQFDHFTTKKTSPIKITLRVRMPDQVPDQFFPPELSKSRRIRSGCLGCPGCPGRRSAGPKLFFERHVCFPLRRSYGALRVPAL